MIIHLLNAALLLGFSLAEGLSGRQERPQTSAPYVERIERQFSFYPGGKIEIAAGAPGNIEVTGWDRATVSIEAEQIVYYLPPVEAKALAEQYPLRIKYGQTSASIATQTPPKATAAMEVNLKIRVPKSKTDLKIRVLEGDLSAGQINGWIEADLARGNIRAAALQGYFSATTKAGDIIAEMAGKRWDGQGFSAATQRGAVHLRLPADYSAALQVETRSGNITIDYPEQVIEGEKIPLHIVVKDSARSLTASVGAGGASIRLHTAAGDIHLSAIEKF